MNKIAKKLLPSLLTAGLVVTSLGAYGSPSPAPAQQVQVTGVTDDGVLGRKIQALVDNEADHWLKRFYLDSNLLMLMPAPGTNWALAAGSTIGSINTNNLAMGYANNVVGWSLGMFTKKGAQGAAGVSLGINDENGNAISLGNSNPLSAGAVYNNLAGFVNKDSPDVTNLTSINPSYLMQNNSIKTSQYDMTAQVKSLIAILGVGFPSSDSAVLSAAIATQDKTPLTATQQESLGQVLASYAVTGVSVDALSEIVARRTPGPNNLPTVMEVMDNYSKSRFTNPSWYNSVSVSSDTALLREIAHMMAFNSWMSYQQFKISEQQTALLATMNTVFAQLNASMAKMNAQIAQAQANAALHANDYSSPNSTSVPSSTGTTGTTSTDTSGGTSGGSSSNNTPSNSGSCAAGTAPGTSGCCPAGVKSGTSAAAAYPGC